MMKCIMFGPMSINYYYYYVCMYVYMYVCMYVHVVCRYENILVHRRASSYMDIEVLTL